MSPLANRMSEVGDIPFGDQNVGGDTLVVLHVVRVVVNSLLTG